MLFFRGHCGSILGNPGPICQTNCLSFCINFVVKLPNLMFVISIVNYYNHFCYTSTLKFQVCQAYLAEHCMEVMQFLVRIC